MRSKFASGDKAIVAPVICPTHHLPPFQWNAQSDNMGDISRIELIDTDGDNFNVPTPFYGWTNTGWDIAWASEGLDFEAQGSAHNSLCTINGNYFWAKAGEIIRFHCDAEVTATNAPSLNVYEDGVNVASYDIVDGENNIEHTVTGDVSIFGGGLYFTITTPHLCATILNISNTTIEVDLLNQFFPTLTSDAVVDGDTYYFYNGETLNFLLPEGLYYLMITMENGHVLYSDWFSVSCVYENLITEFTNNSYATFTASGTYLELVQAVAGGGDAESTDTFAVILGETLTLICYMDNVINRPLLSIYSESGGHIISNEEELVGGLNEITFTMTEASGTAILYIRSPTSLECAITEIILIRSFSPDYIKFLFEHSCNLGDIVYDTGYEGVVYLQTEPMEVIFPYVEKGAENGYGEFVPVWQRQDKHHLIRTNLISLAMLEVLHRLKLHDTIFLTDLVGDVWVVNEIFIEHAWQFDDKYFALATLTVNLGEGILLTGCCTGINECL